MHDPEQLLGLTADIVIAALGTGHVAASQVPTIIAETYAALAATAETDAPSAAEPKSLEPAVSIRSSVKPDYLVSLIDGSHLKMLRRHLNTHGYTPESYRAAFGLPGNYPMVAPNYAARRRDLAVKHGLGRKKVA